MLLGMHRGFELLRVSSKCLQFVTTIGTIVFGLWLASKVLGGGDDGKSGR